MSYFRPDMDPEHVSLIYDAGVGGINNKQMNITQFRLVMYNYGLVLFLFLSVIHTSSPSQRSHPTC